MSLETSVPYDDLTALFESALPDLVLAFAFFTALVYAVLGKRFDHQRSAITMSVVIGLAFSIGLIWWEQAQGLSIKNLGPVAVGFALLVLAFIMYQAIRQVGGSWAGAGIALGLSLLIASILGFKPPLDTQIIHSVIMVALLIGLLAFLLRRPGHPTSPRFANRYLDSEITDFRRDMSQLYRDRHLSKRLGHRLKHMRQEADQLQEHPEKAGDIAVQLQRMLPAEGYLTERMAQLRTQAYRVRNGHIARLQETRKVFAQLPASVQKEASDRLAARYRQIIGMDTRLERLDCAVAETEKRIKDLTQKARQYTSQYDYPRLLDCLQAAQKLQRHNSKLFAIIERTEAKLTGLVKKLAAEARRRDRS